MSLNSKTISHSAQKLNSAEKKAESSGAGGGQELKRLPKSKGHSKSWQKDPKDDSDQGDEPNQLSKGEKIVAESIVKIQSFIRMSI